jgi:threonine/homoserine/homoserine lactone efflux protein
MVDTVLIVQIAVILPPLTIAAVSGLFAAKRANREGTIKPFSFRKGAWISVLVSLFYYGFLALLAAVNSWDTGGLLAVLFAVLVTAVFAVICFCLYFGSYRAFRRLFRRNGEQTGGGST